MGKVRPQDLFKDSSDTSSSDDESYTVDYDRYQAASIADGLRNRDYRVSALRELQEVVTQGYTAASKKVQVAIFHDLLIAVQQHDSRVRVAEATAALVTAAKRVLPQQRRNQLIKEQKQAAVASKRAARKHTDAVDDVEYFDSDCFVAAALGDVPSEVVELILQALDPVSLAAAACVCRSWHQLATSNDLWQQHLQLVFPNAARQLQQPQQQHQQHRCQPGITPQVNSAQCSATPTCSSRGGPSEGGAYRGFCCAAQRLPSMLLPWRSCRALLRGRLQWLPAGDVQAPRAAAAARAARRGVLTPGPVYADQHQAVSWIMGKPWSEVLRSSYSDNSSSVSSRDGSSSDGEESHAHLQGLRLWAVQKLPDEAARDATSKLGVGM